MFGLGTPELLIVLVLVLLLFGGAKLPQMMRGLGQGMKEFKKATNDDDDPALTTGTPGTSSNVSNNVSSNPSNRTQV
jgi:TatA/E family protein of Tat protein translocase